jgi:selenocysteine lyase/cysteine desulfurase
VQRALAAHHINTSVSRAGSTRFDFELRGISEVVRASVHYFNTEEELQRLLDAVAGLAAAGAK